MQVFSLKEVEKINTTQKTNTKETLVKAVAFKI